MIIPSVLVQIFALLLTDVVTVKAFTIPSEYGGGAVGRRRDVLSSPVVNFHPEILWRHPDHIIRRFSSTPLVMMMNNQPEDEEVDADSMFGDLFNLSSMPSSSQQRQNSDPTLGIDLEELRARFEEKSPTGDVTENSSSRSSIKAESRVDEEGIYLDADTYVQSSNSLTDDGMLTNEVVLEGDILESAAGGFTSSDGSSSGGASNNDNVNYRDLVEVLIRNAAPPSPTAAAESPSQSYSSSNPEPSLDDLWNAIAAQQRQLQNNNADGSGSAAVSEDLHEQVFAEEQAFLEQSEEFRAALVDSSKADEAAALRNGQEARERQRKAAEQLAKDVDAFEAELLARRREETSNQGAASNDDGKNQDNEEPRCSKCFCRLDPLEIRATESYQGCCQVCHSEQLVQASLERNQAQAERLRQMMAEQQADEMKQLEQRKNINRRQSLPGLRRPPPLVQNRKAGATSASIASLRKQTSAQLDRRTGSGAANTKSPIPRPIRRPQPPTSNNAAVEDPRRIDNPLSTPTKQPIDAAAKSNTNASWKKVEDQETGDIFYWNEETDEMRWDNPNTETHS